MAEERYYALVASLPKLDHFERATRLPITRRRLDQRLTMLSPLHRRDLERAEALTQWKQHPLTRTAAEVVAQYDRAVRDCTDPYLRDYIVERMDQRTILVALRRRRLGEKLSTDKAWGVGRWTRWIPQHFDEPDLGLATVHPWIPEARVLLDRGDALGLERHLMRSVWSRLAKLAESEPFSFQQVFAFVFQWDILSRWITYDAEQAAPRFQELVDAVVADHGDVFSAQT